MPKIYYKNGDFIENVPINSMKGESPLNPGTGYAEAGVAYEGGTEDFEIGFSCYNAPIFVVGINHPPCQDGWECETCPLRSGLPEGDDWVYRSYSNILEKAQKELEERLEENKDVLIRLKHS